MQFLPDVYISCDQCRGKRYNSQTLEVRFKGKNIHEVLELTVEEAAAFFRAIPAIAGKLQTLEAVGLGYITLGQSALTLSGGEAQRVKLSLELSRRSTGRTLYILDEPTTGLHFADVQKLLEVLNRLVEAGNTVLVVEHNPEVIKTADWVVDLGPEGGEAGGEVVAAGPPERVAEQPRSHTGAVLRRVLRQSRRAPRPAYDPQAARAKRQVGDVDEELEALRVTARPWQVDGRRWHTELRRLQARKPPLWEPEALTSLVELIAKLDPLVEPHWEGRDEVTLLHRGAVSPFCTINTDRQLVLTVTLLVKPGQFEPQALERRLGLVSYDAEAHAAHACGPRIWQRPWVSFEELHLRIVRRSEVDTPNFHTFIRAALRGYRETAGVQEVDVDRVGAGVKLPWLADGYRWHTEQRKSHDDREPIWREGLKYLAELIEEVAPDLDIEWHRRDQVLIRLPEAKPKWRVRTHEWGWFRLELRFAKGSVDLDDWRERLDLRSWDDIAEVPVYGSWQRLHIGRWWNVDGATLFLNRRCEMETPQFRQFLSACAAGYRELVEDYGQ
jgi:excinuclease ABC subunit A